MPGKSDQNLINELCRACADGRAEKVAELLKKGVAVNGFADSENDDRSPLTAACKNGRLEIASLLLKAGADPNRKDKKGETPLVAAWDPYETAYRFFSVPGFDYPENPELVDTLTSLLLQHGAKADRQETGKNGPLHLALKYGHEETARLLIKNGAGIDFRGEYGCTPLYYAALFTRSLNMVEQLVRAGADVNSLSDSKDNLLFSLITGHGTQTKIPDYENSVLGIVRFLIDQGLDLHYRHPPFGSALHWAAYMGRRGIAGILLEKGMDVNLPDRDGKPPLSRAINRERFDTIELLLEHGAEIDAIPAEETRGLPVNAVAGGNLQALKALIKAGLDVNRKSQWGETPLMKAVASGRMDIAEYLLQIGADLKESTPEGHTPLLYAAAAGQDEMVKLLLNFGADIHEKNNLNWNALMQACHTGHLSTVRLLLKAGSRTDEIDLERGETALSLARQSGNTELTAFLESEGVKHRPIRERQPGEKYFSILDCDICAYVPHERDLGINDAPVLFPGLEEIHRNESGDHHVSDIQMIMQCRTCGTYYCQSYYFDDEDSIGGAGPVISNWFRRYNLFYIRELLRQIGDKGRAAELSDRIGEITEKLLSAIKEDRPFPPYILPFVVETGADDCILRNDGKTLQEWLVQHQNPEIVFATLSHLMKVWTQSPAENPELPLYQNVATLESVRQQARTMLPENKAVIRKAIGAMAESDDAQIKRMGEALLKSGTDNRLFS